MNESEWEQVGTVEILALRIYPIDVTSEHPLRTEVAVEPGIYPLLRRFDAYRWMMTGRIDERHAKIGDGLFAMQNGNVPTGPQVVFSSRVYGPEQLAEFLRDPIARTGPAQRLRFTITTETMAAK